MTTTDHELLSIADLATRPEFDYGPGLRMEAQINAAESEAIAQRWEFGRWMLSHVPAGGKKLPDGFLDGLVEATGKSRSELQYRRQFAERFPSAEALSTAVDNRRSWTEIRDQLAEGSTHVTRNTGDHEWYTPPELIEAARAAMGGIDLDPASSDVANEVVRAETIFTAEHDGLAEEWRGRVWMNPPYGHPLIKRFTRKLVGSYTEGDVSAAVTLVNNATETAWLQHLLGHAAAICFPKYRIRFRHPDYQDTSAPLQGQAVVYLGKDPATFCEQFAQFGIARIWGGVAL